MTTWSLYRYRNRDGSSKDWAVRTNPDGSITTRWGKTADRLPGVSTRRGVRQFDIERERLLECGARVVPYAEYVAETLERRVAGQRGAHA